MTLNWKAHYKNGDSTMDSFQFLVVVYVVNHELKYWFYFE